jgi:plastocyanin
MNQLTIASLIVAGGLVAGTFVATSGTATENRIKTFDIVMENNQYRPAEITANVGDQVVINFENRDAVSHAVALPEFNAAVPNGHVPAGGRATMQFVASRAVSTDAAVCGGADPTDKTDDHGEELIVTII